MLRLIRHEVNGRQNLGTKEKMGEKSEEKYLEVKKLAERKDS